MSSMLFLNMPSETLKKDYKKKFLGDIVKRVKGELGGRKLSDAAREILLPHWNTDHPDTSILEELLVTEPKRLKELNDELWDKLQKLPCWKRPDKKRLNE
ncbi:MAG: hypothetical protein J5965_22175, partial [Aeriscardovia sp.]|nr:hypothetical protein [Aeriscardovia sp.]